MSLTLYKWIIRFHYIASLPSDSKRESGFQKQLVRCLLYKERYVIELLNGTSKKLFWKIIFLQKVYQEK